MCELLCKTARVTSTPSDGRGVFSFTIAAFTVDSDGEIVANYVNVGENSKTVVPMDYGHLALLGAGADPLAQKIGVASVSREGKLLRGDAKLDLSNRVAMMVYERLQLDSSDPAHLGEVSVWFSFDPANVSVDGEGIRTIKDATLLSVSVVKEGAQATAIEAVKSRFSKACKIGPDGKKTCSPTDHFRPLEVPPSRVELVDAFGGPAGLRAAMDRALAKHTLAKLRKPKLVWDEPAWHKKSIADMAARSARIDAARSAKAKKDKAMRVLMDAAPLGAMRSSTKIDRTFRVINDPVTPAPSGPPEIFRVPQGPVDDGPVRGRRP